MPMTIEILDSDCCKFNANIYLRRENGIDKNMLHVSRKRGAPSGYLYDVFLFPSTIPGVGGIARHFPFTRSRKIVGEVSDTIRGLLRKNGETVEIHLDGYQTEEA